MTRIALAAVALALTPAAAFASSGAILYDVCNPTWRAAANDEACACAHRAAAAESAAAKTGSDPDYSDWEDGFTLGPVSMDAVSDPGTDNCFELRDRVNGGTFSMRNEFTERLYRSLTRAATQFGYTPHFTRSDTDWDPRADTVGGFITYGTETTTSGPGGEPLEGIGLITELDPYMTVLGDQHGHDIGMAHTGGRTIEGAQTQDFNQDGLMDVRVFLADGTVLNLMGETGGMDFWDISQFQ